ncbi:hypothetical protein PHLGIDRAFT_126117 [Phlebiopsis gigantea 11061_1 CR5-6]|uniref:Uncharacterized protein n=1 Tax=Phlebiopsis gigantea (strain 11061_1 CR5-6) TaxID=745531 RepID=A0A0C3NWA2_PHLG1|nr:hypothetical protein PHLGIDRAFT_126117 [Phlebiopsis gigantea 11061_1 CR5-6]
MLLRQVWVTALSVLLAFNLASKLLGYVWLKYHVHDDVNTVPWSTDKGEVYLQFDTWARYRLHSADEWAALYPGNGLVHLGRDQEPHTVAMLHQLRCIDFVRDQITRPAAARDGGQTRHCMNYLREMLMCHADDTLDAYQYVHKTRALDAQPVRRCRDWRAVYERVERSQLGRNGTGRA